MGANMLRRVRIDETSFDVPSLQSQPYSRAILLRACGYDRSRLGRVRVLIAGCGYLGTELGLRLARAGSHEVWGLSRNPIQLPPCIRPIAADLLSPALESHLPNVDGVVYAASADASSVDRYRDAYVSGVENLLDALQTLSEPPSRVIFVSSTAVYGDAEGEWVDEETSPSPMDFRGVELLNGEDLVRSGTIPGVVVRLGGIYGPGRTRLLERVRSGQARCPSDGPVWSNRIHRDDAAGALIHLLLKNGLDPVYIGVDDEPSPICDVYRYVAELVGVDPPAVDPEAQPPRLNRRCSNQLLRATGYELEFPSFREGYRDIVDSEEDGVR